MDSEYRNTGIDVLGDVPWGTHFCQFYETAQDLIDILVPYFKAGLESGEFCMWVTAEPLTKRDAEAALRAVMPDLDDYIVKRQIEIIPHTKWYLKNGKFDQERVLDGWVEKLNKALHRGYEGLRLTGNTFWLEKSDWAGFTAYEEAINSVIGNYRMIAMCTYSVDKCGASEIADVLSNHEFALIKRSGKWTIIESAEHKQTKDSLRQARRELEARSRELEEANEALAATNEDLETSNEELRCTNDELQTEIAARRQAEGDLHRLNRTLQAHSKSDQAMMRATDETDYLQEACRTIVEDCGHAMVWIGYAEEDEGKTVRPVAYSGFEEGYLDKLKITWADTERGHGPTGTAIRTGKPVSCKNMVTDPAFKPWREEALKRGYASSIVLPLMEGERAFGAVTIYSREPDAFIDDEVELLTELANDLAYGILALRLRAAHARAEAALRESRERAERHAAELESFFSSMGDGAAIFDVKGKPVIANDAARRIFDAPPGVPFDEWSTAYKLQTLDGEPIADENYPSRRALRGEAVPDTRYRLVTPWVETFISETVSPVRSAEGEIVGTVAIFRDVSEQVEFEHQKDELYEREHHIAELLQEALIPQLDYNSPGWKMAVRYQPALEEARVGGDFYDVFDLGDGKVGVMIGDVAGKGLRAAMRVAAVRHAVRSYAYIEPDPAMVMTLTNQAIIRDNPEGDALMTAFFGVVDLCEGTMHYTNAGHEPPILLAAGSVPEEIGSWDPALGFYDGATYSETLITLEEGDAVVMITDGVTEARAVDGKLYGKDRVIDWLREHQGATLDEIADGILEAAGAFAGGSLRDDAAVLIFSADMNILQRR